MVKRSLIVAIFSLSLIASAADKQLVNKDADGFAVQRFDPVAFFVDGRPEKGDPKIQSIYQGARYVFTSADHKRMFDAEPAKYVPVYGGYCAYGVANGHTVPVKIETWQIFDNKLILNYDSDVRTKFDKDKSGNLQKADANWPGLVDKQGK
jgi:YHS domain-containing protein